MKLTSIVTLTGLGLGAADALAQSMDQRPKFTIRGPMYYFETSDYPICSPDSPRYLAEVFKNQDSQEGNPYPAHFLVYAYNCQNDKQVLFQIEVNGLFLPPKVIMNPPEQIKDKIFENNAYKRKGKVEFNLGGKLADYPSPLDITLRIKEEGGKQYEAKARLEREGNFWKHQQFKEFTKVSQ